ncbi:YIP1 family protein [Ruegeria sp. Ofav3-42]|uniref:YIP1 family protein n=1 Tax=Ruegeria sp. Ofav3-42 TaxID=2917759 RepID=UPI001EF6EDE8|nr:YIP1 family protein [Ruegeria sp. Ofav3-42]MCG7518258.1 YIP1 family protein [Ruegeria sp. Ofav3-42]
MNPASIVELGVLTLTNPSQAARRLLDLRPGREVLWLAFFLAVVLNGLVQLGIDQLIPVPEGEPVPPTQPIALNLLRSAGAMMLSVAAFLFVGRMLGGRATFDDILTLTVWLQFLQIAALLITLIITIALPFLMLMFLLATALISLYVTLHFLNEAHQFGSLAKSFGVIVLSALIAVPFVLALTPGGPV